MSEAQQSQQTATTSTATDSQQGLVEGTPSHERQAELEAAYERNMGAGRAPYVDVEIRTLGELRWVLGRRQWNVQPDNVEGKRADLSGADFG